MGSFITMESLLKLVALGYLVDSMRAFGSFLRYGSLLIQWLFSVYISNFPRRFSLGSRCSVCKKHTRNDVFGVERPYKACSCISYGRNSGRVSMHSTEDNEGTNCGTVSEVNVEETTNDARQLLLSLQSSQRWPVYRNRSTIPTRFAV
ncbi:hypothetical protein LINPERHAP2_LOCUS40320 [Linum perenne]